MPSGRPPRASPAPPRRRGAAGTRGTRPSREGLEEQEYDEEQDARTREAHDEETRVPRIVEAQVHEPEHHERELHEREEEQQRDHEPVREPRVTDPDLDTRQDDEDHPDPDVFLGARVRVTGMTGLAGVRHATRSRLFMEPIELLHQVPGGFGCGIRYTTVKITIHTMS